MSDSVNEYGLGAPNTQTGENAERVYETEGVYDTTEGTGVGPTDGPLLGDDVLGEDGTRYGLGDENTQEGDLMRDNTDPDIQYQPGMRAGSDPLEHGLESEDRR